MPDAIYISHSRLEEFLKCREFARLTTEGWKPLRTTSALQFGIMAHSVLEHFYLEARDGLRSAAPEALEVVKYIRKLGTEWLKSPEGSRGGSEAVQQLEMQLTLLEAVLPGYYRFWGKIDFKQTKWVALEEKFEYEVPCEVDGVAYKVVFVGYIDGMYREGKSDLCLLETKTKSRIDEETIQELLALDGQTDTYCNAVARKHGSYPVAVRYNIIRKPGQRLGKTETLEQFGQRIEEEVAEDPKKYFLRYRIDKNKKELIAFQKELEIKVREFVMWKLGKLPTYKNQGACMGRMGTCRFLPICAHQNFSSFYRTDKRKAPAPTETKGGK